MNQQFTPGLKSFIENIEIMADNKYVLGDRLVEIGISGPNLEATLAAIAMAQGELGHARMLYHWALDLKGITDKRPEVDYYTGKAFSACQKVENWIELMAVLFAANAAFELVLNSMLNARRPEVASRIRKLVKEQEEHVIYSRNWAKLLLRDTGTVPRRFKEGLARIVPEVLSWLKSLDEAKALADEGFIAAEGRFAAQFQAQLDLLEEERMVADAI